MIVKTTFTYPILKCEDCGWIGDKPLVRYSVLEESEEFCPKCGSINLEEIGINES